jgi:hypothetical protein
MLLEDSRWLRKLRFRAVQTGYAALEPMMTRRFRRVSNTHTIGGRLLPDDITRWTFHDQDWPRVVHRFHDRSMVRRQQEVLADDTPQFAGSRLRFSGPGDIIFSADACPDNWLYLHIDPATCPWRNYRWSFSVRCMTPFRELQFAFRYRDFYNRYRYRFERGYLHFDIVHQGDFYGSLSKVECPLEVGTWYPVEIDVVEDYFCCRVGTRLLSVDYDPTGQFRCGPVAVILWEDDGRTGIGAEIRDMRIVAIQPRRGTNE